MRSRPSAAGLHSSVVPNRPRSASGTPSRAPGTMRSTIKGAPGANLALSGPSAKATPRTSSNPQVQAGAGGKS